MVPKTGSSFLGKYSLIPGIAKSKEEEVSVRLSGYRCFLDVSNLVCHGKFFRKKLVKTF